ncbi:MAG TPA: hypothetical protein EYP98_05035, partial [Planctomycetes bacterium]|nr:hypothetical protein [Planctomycetota bacterium]
MLHEAVTVPLAVFVLVVGEPFEASVDGCRVRLATPTATTATTTAVTATGTAAEANRGVPLVGVEGRFLGVFFIGVERLFLLGHGRLGHDDFFRDLFDLGLRRRRRRWLFNLLFLLDLHLGLELALISCFWREQGPDQ